MPLSSQMHTPKLIGQDEDYITYGCDPEEFAKDGHKTEETGDGVLVTMAKRKSDGKLGVLSCKFKKSSYDEAKAGKWMESQKFSIEPADMHNVKDVEIFSTGLWNNKQITEADLDTIVESFSSTKGVVRPFLKLGHDEDQKLLQSDGLPAAGWVENVRRVGSKLVADFVDIPKKIYQLIKNNAYRKVSCEIYNNIQIDGKKYPKMLGAVALLGADLPGVMNLNDILSLYSAGDNFWSIEKFAADRGVVIIEEETDSQFTDKEGNIMPNEIDVYKVKLDQAEKDVEAAKSLVSQKDAEIEKYKKEADEAKKLVADAAQKAKLAEVDAFVSTLQSEKLCSKAMAPLVKALIAEDKEKYSVDSEEFSKFDLVKKILSSAKEASKVNFSETTKDEKAEGDDKNLEAKIDKYMAEHKVEYGIAYRAVVRGVDLPSQPL